MSISATSCNGYRALNVASAPNNPSVISFFCWAKSTADPSAYRTYIDIDAADSALPDSGVRFGTGGSDGAIIRAAKAGTIVATNENNVYWWQGANRNNWRAVAGWIDGSATTADVGTFFGTNAQTTAVDISAGTLTGLMDDFYVLRNGYVGVGWGAQVESVSANLRVAHIAIWVGYKLTASDMTALAAGTNPIDIGGGPRWYWPLVTQAGDGLVDDVAGVTLAAYGGTATWHDADNPTVSAPTPDTTPPTLTSPTGTQTGSTTATGTVSTNEANGTLYRLASTNATELVATVKAAALTQSVTATGTQSVSFTGLTPSTTYYAHYVHTDAAGNDSTRVSSASFTTAAAADTTPPTLTSPTGTQTGSTTAGGTVSTNEGNGTLYRLASTNATELASTVKAAALTSTVTTTGTQSVTFAGLIPSTTYYAHYVHTDAAGNDSARVSSASFTTAAAADSTPPSWGAATLSSSSVTTTSFTVTASAAATDNVGVAGYETSFDGGSTYTANSPVTSLSRAYSGGTPGATVEVRMRAYDAAGNRSAAIGLSQALNNTTITLGPFASSGTVWPSGTTINLTWLPGGRIGDASGFSAAVQRTATLSTGGTVAVTGLPAGAGIALVAKRVTNATDDEVCYQPGTVA